MRYIVRGGQPLRGTVRAGPAKNALLPELAAALLTEDEMRIVPAARMRDVQAMVDLLRAIGATVQWGSAAGLPSLTVRAAGRLHPEPPAEAVARMRASVLVMGPLLARSGRVLLATPGGCAIGDRPIDLHLQAMRALGAEVREQRGRVDVRAPHGLRGARIVLPFPSHTATENALMAACAARGESVIVGAAREPEIADLAIMLQAMGAHIHGIGERTLWVEGGAPLRGVIHHPLADRIEAGTWLLAGAVTGGDVRVEGVDAAHLRSLLNRLVAAGLTVQAEDRTIRLRGMDAGQHPRAVDIRTQPHPGYPTDLQPQFCVLAAMSTGSCLVHETVFSHRLRHLADLVRMGANVWVYGDRFAWFSGPTRLRGARVTARDLRGGAAMVLAGLVANGETVVEGAEHVARGYTDLAAILRSLGADIASVEDGTREPVRLNGQVPVLTAPLVPHRSVGNELATHAGGVSAESSAL